ncbi:helix-hairpin-helix domain-containing protein, partial [Cryobacterium sp. N22]|uniref:ComEA family DNA-binding protein n=1 Tax=Cryobacterium sp. N22 TaxID=2048290 RepID=UPI0011AFD7D0
RSTRAQRRADADAAARAGAPTRVAPSVAPAPAPAPARSAAVPEAELVDVNTANQRTLAKLTGMDRGLAKAAIAERTKRGGFASLEAFAATAGLQPHELVRLGNEAFCSPRPRANRSFGRRVDY